jgi:hypothetical protein
MIIASFLFSYCTDPITSCCPEGLVGQVTISGTQTATSMACLLVKMVVLHAKATYHSPERFPYPKDKKAEAQLNMSTFYAEMRATAFSTKQPQSIS